MRHRHSGPKVKYITRRNNIRYRQRPTHRIPLIKKHMPIRRHNLYRKRKSIRRHYDPEEQERHLDNIRRLQQQNLQLKDELEESWKEVNEKLEEWESAFKEGKTESESFGEWRNYIQSLHKQKTLQENIINKLNAIEEEKEFLE